MKQRIPSLDDFINEDKKVSGMFFHCVKAGIAETYNGEARSCDVLEDQVLEAIWEDTNWYRAKFVTAVNLQHVPGLSGKKIAPNTYVSSRDLEVIIRKAHIVDHKNYKADDSDFWAEFKIIEK